MCTVYTSFKITSRFYMKLFVVTNLWFLIFYFDIFSTSLSEKRLHCYARRKFCAELASIEVELDSPPTHC